MTNEQKRTIAELRFKGATYAKIGEAVFFEEFCLNLVVFLLRDGTLFEKRIRNLNGGLIPHFAVKFLLTHGVHRL